MSYDLYAYFESVNDSIIPQWILEMKKNHFECEFHPKFSFKTQSGFLPIKVRILKSHITRLCNNDFVSGFEMSVSNDLDNKTISEHIKNIERLKLQKPKQSLINKLTKKTVIGNEFFDNIKERIQKSSVELTLYTGSDFLEVITAWYAIATLVTILDGVLYDPQEGKYYNKTNAIEMAKEVFDGFQSINIDEWQLHPFKKWA